MLLFARTDQSLFGRWWWTVDRWLIAALGLLLVFGAFLIATAGPAIADQYSYSANYFIIHHLVLLVPAVGSMFAISLLSPRYIRLLAMVGFACSVFALALIPFIGAEVKGGQRWFRIFGFSLQPSEFVKPCFIILTAWLFAHPAIRGRFVMKSVPLLLLMMVIGLLLLQPDVGMSIVVTLVWLGQLFLAGLPIWLVIVLALGGLGLMVGVYFTLPHFASRIDRFLNPASGDTYQIDRATEAFANGGLFGTGPGQGVVKESLPDAHSDFIFAVAGEELGLIWCLVLVSIVTFIVLRGLYRSSQSETLFVTLASSGLLLQFGLQSLINMASALHIIPTKGMTLPFVSYGGSSLLAMGLTMGMLLALTRRRPGA